MKKYNLKFITAYFYPAYKAGGPPRSLYNLFYMLRDIRSVEVFTSAYDIDGSNISNELLDNVNYFNNFFIFLLAIFKSLDKKNLYYFNSFFSFKYSIIPFLFVRNYKVVFAPRGEFYPGALSISPIRKKIYIFLFKLLFSNKRITFHATCNDEKDFLLKYFPHNDIYVCKNLSILNVLPEKEIPFKTDTLKCVFYSRISPKKNLDHLLNLLRCSDINLQLDIYGNIEDEDYFKKCSNICKNLPLNIDVNYRGVLFPDDVVKTLGHYDVFLLLTKGENFGHVISEALHACLPIVLPDTTPWTNIVLENNIGSIVDDFNFHKTLTDYDNLSPSDFYQYRLRINSFSKTLKPSLKDLDPYMILFSEV